MIGSKPLIDKLNDLLASGTLTNLQVTQLSAAVDTVENRGVGKVLSVSSLPPAALNVGRFFYIEDERRYVFSNGVTWSIDNLFAVYPTAWAWGSNGGGRLGDGTITSRSSPVSVLNGFSDWVQVSTGNNHSLGLRANGSAWAWGLNTNGRLGNDSSTSSRRSPVSVVGGFNDWVQISAGYAHTIALRANGSAWAWGYNGSGRLGDDTITERSSPVSVVGGFLDWKQVSAGGNFTVALRANGSAWSWGNNSNGGQLGDDTTTARSSPVSVVGGFLDWVQVSAGSVHSVALRANGSAWAWGYNGSGRLGNNSVTSSLSPVSVVGGFTDWTQVSAGGNFTVALRANGSAWSWGSNTNGRLGDNTTTARSSPISVIGGFLDWVQVSAGESHSIGVRANGSAWAWGSNSNGRLGDDTGISKRSPVSVVGDFNDWAQVSAGYFSLGVRA